MSCTACGKALTGGLDTFGPPTRLLCQECYWVVGDAPQHITVHFMELDDNGIIVSEGIRRELNDEEGKNSAE